MGIIINIIAWAEILVVGALISRVIEGFLSPVRHRLLNILIWPVLGIVATLPIQKADVADFAAMAFPNLWYILLFFYVIVFIGYKGAFIAKTSVGLLFSPTLVAIGLIVDLLFRGDRSIYLILYLLPVLVWGAMSFLVNRKIPAVKMYFTTRVMLLADCVCLAPLVAVLFVSSTSQEQVIATLVISFSCIATNIGVLLLMAFLGESAKSQLETESYRLQHDYYLTLEEHQTEVQKLQHDMKHHIQMMEDLVDGDSWEQAEGYVEQVKTAYTQEHPLIRFCNHTLVNALLANKYRLMQSSFIQTEIQVSLDKSTLLDDVDLCSLFANTIDNAMEACEQIDSANNRRIIIKSRIHNGFFSYQIINSIRPGSVKKEADGSIKTSKRDLARHGYGLGNIYGFVEKYKGNIDIAIGEDTFELTVIVPVE